MQKYCFFPLKPHGCSRSSVSMSGMRYALREMINGLYFRDLQITTDDYKPLLLANPSQV